MENKNGIRFLYCGDTAVSVEFGNEINAEINNKIKSLSMDFASSPIKGIIEYIPTYRSLLINYDPGLISGESLIKKLKKRTASLKSAARDKKTVFLIPVCYDDEFALDIGNVCSHSGLSKDEIIRIHSGTDYLIYMLGFLPGFPYLGGLDERIFTPRLETPRTIIPAGSVGIGGKQTGIYPLASPGGWQLIGKTPVKTYDPEREAPILFSAGDYIRFCPVSKTDFELIKKDADAGSYSCEIIKE